MKFTKGEIIRLLLERPQTRKEMTNNLNGIKNLNLKYSIFSILNQYLRQPDLKLIIRLLNSIN